MNNGELFDEKSLQKAIEVCRKDEAAFYVEVGGGKARYRLVEKNGERFPQKALGVLATRYYSGCGNSKDFNTNAFNQAFERFGFELIGKIDPTDAVVIDQETERQKRLAEILVRKKQAKLRAQLLNTYKRCVISGFHHSAGLQAAHIVPFSKSIADDSIGNALLLRADIHLLFDADIVSIDPETLEIKAPKKVLGDISLDQKRFLKVLHEGGYLDIIKKNLS